MRFPFNKDPLKPALEEMSHSVVPDIEFLRIDLIEPFHAAGESRDRSLDEQVVVIRHQDEGVKDPLVKADDFTEEVEKEQPVSIGPVDHAGFVAATGHMPDHAWMFEA